MHWTKFALCQPWTRWKGRWPWRIYTPCGKSSSRPAKSTRKSSSPRQTASTLILKPRITIAIEATPSTWNKPSRPPSKVDASDRRLSYYRGVALVLEEKDPAVAEKDLRTYIDTVPDNSEVPAHSSAYEWLGKLYENEEKPDLAAEQFKAGLALDPQNKTLREALKKLQKR